MGEMNEYFAAHPMSNSGIHVSIGLGIAWLVSLSWASSTVALVLGIIFLVIGIGGHIYPLFAKQ
ncbi:hypothetical protein ACFLV3_03155 [Chloroflexota bacterium]